MVKVAVAGGTGHIGRYIVESILATKKHEVVVLSRSPHPDLENQGVKVALVSYTDPSSLENALQGVHTVISTIVDSKDPNGWVASQLALLEAAKKVGAKRFAPSEFAFRGKPNDVIEIYAYKAPVSEAAKQSGLEYTIFECGLWTNFLASGTPGIGYLRPLKWIVDVENCSAEIPGDGTTPVILTRAEDVGAFVAASLDLAEWPEVSTMVGDKTTWNEVISVAEKIRGKKFAVTYLPVDELQRRIAANPSGDRANFFLQGMLEYARGDRFADVKANLNELCPDIKPMKLEEFLEKCWGKTEA